jgi:hypothetical protein
MFGCFFRRLLIDWFLLPHLYFETGVKSKMLRMFHACVVCDTLSRHLVCENVINGGEQKFIV